MEKGGAVMTEQAWTELAVARFRKPAASQLNLMSFRDFSDGRRSAQGTTDPV
jgi:hypothetical protein